MCPKWCVCSNMRVHTKYIAIEDITIMIGLEFRGFHRLSFLSTWYFCPNVFTHSYRVIHPKSILDRVIILSSPIFHVYFIIADCISR